MRTSRSLAAGLISLACLATVACAPQAPPVSGSPAQPEAPAPVTSSSTPAATPSNTPTPATTPPAASPTQAAPTAKASATATTAKTSAKPKATTNKASAKPKATATKTTKPKSAKPKAAPSASSSQSAKSSGRAGGVDCSVDKCVALTYDDGPGPHTLKLVSHLDAAGVKATFFMLGNNAKARPDVVKKVAASGHVVANHTVDHKNLKTLGIAKQKWEVDTARQTLRSLSGQSVNLMRPPYGSFNANTRKLGVPIILWDVDTLDWKNRSAATTTRRALAGARKGSIILMHDIHPSSVAATPGIIKELRKRGFKLVTVPQLLGSGKAGSVYTNGAR